MSLRSSWLALAAGTAIAGMTVTQCGGVVSTIGGDAGGDSPSSSSSGASGSGSSSGASGSGSGSSSGSTSSSGASSGSTGSSSGTWASCFPSDGTYREHFMSIFDGGAGCMVPQDSTVTFPTDGGNMFPPGCTMTDNPCSLHCKTDNGGYVSVVDEQWTAWATGVDGTAMLETYAPDGGVVYDCGFSFVLTKQ
jgi:hypothetical protein